MIAGHMHVRAALLPRVAVLAALVPAAVACASPRSSTTPAPSASLQVRVVYHSSAPPPGGAGETEVFSRTTASQAAIADLTSIPAALRSVPPTDTYGCPDADPAYLSYQVRVLRAGQPAETVTTAATGCRFWMVQVQQTKSVYCCANDTIWARLHADTGAPFPLYLPAGQLPTELDPLALTVGMRQQGTVAAKDLTLIATVSLANQSAQPVGILFQQGRFASQALRFSVASIYGTLLWEDAWKGGGGGFPAGLQDIVTLAPGASQTWTVPLAINGAGGFLPGVTFVVVAAADWHEGTISPDGEFAGPEGRVAGLSDIVLR